MPIYDKDIFNILAKRFNTIIEVLEHIELALMEGLSLFEGVHRNASKMCVVLSEV